jgi:hypothetical protein
MAEEIVPDGDPPVRKADLEQAGAWLAGHCLADAPPTPLLATRLAVRRRARLGASILLAAFLILVALVYTGGLADGSGSYRRWSLVMLTAMVAGLVLAQSLLDRWVRRVDRRVGATLPRRAAHPVRLGWRTVLGWPRAAFAAITFAGGIALAISTLSMPDSTSKYAAVILLIGLCGVAVGGIVQLRHVLTRPIVADDEVSLTADVIMRVEDARDVAMPNAVWSLPVVSVFSTTFGWLNAAWIIFIILSIVALALIDRRTVRSGTVARQVTSAL